MCFIIAPSFFDGGARLTKIVSETFLTNIITSPCHVHMCPYFLLLVYANLANYTVNLHNTDGEIRNRDKGLI